MFSFIPKSTATTLYAAPEVLAYHLLRQLTLETASRGAFTASSTSSASPNGVDADVISARRVPRSRMLLVSFLVSTPDIPGILYSSITSEGFFGQRKFDGLSLYSLTISPPTVGIFVSKSSSAIP